MPETKAFIKALGNHSTKPVQLYETAISLSVVCLALQNLGVLHGEKDPKNAFYKRNAQKKR